MYSLLCVNIGPFSIWPNGKGGVLIELAGFTIWPWGWFIEELKERIKKYK